MMSETQDWDKEDVPGKIQARFKRVQTFLPSSTFECQRQPSPLNVLVYSVLK